MGYSNPHLKIETTPLKNVLILEDDKNLSRVISEYCQEEEIFDIYQAYNLQQAREIVKQNYIDAISLDLVLPDGNGLDFLKEIQSLSPSYSAKVVVLTKKTNVKFRTGSLKLGADDYMPKPFSPEELVCRIKKVLGLDGFTNPQKYYVYNNWIKLNMNRHEIHIDNINIKLSKNQYFILEALIKNQGFIKKDDLKDYIEIKSAVRFTDNALRTAINRLRKKLYKITYTRLIRTRYGVGYYIDADCEE